METPPVPLCYDESYARGLATAAHLGQTDKAGRPYIEHLAAVADGVPLPYRPLAWLHDVVEDTEVTSIDLRRAGFTEWFLDDLALLTKRPHEEPYSDRIDRILASGSHRAIRVKFADVSDHLRPGCEHVLSKSKLVDYRAAIGRLGMDLSTPSKRRRNAAEVLVWAAIANGRYSEARLPDFNLLVTRVVGEPVERDAVFTDGIAGRRYADIRSLIEARDTLAEGR